MIFKVLSHPSHSDSMKCQLLSCHCEGLQDSLVASGVTDALGMVDGHGIWGDCTVLDWPKIHPALPKLE